MIGPLVTPRGLCHRAGRGTKTQELEKSSLGAESGLNQTPSGPRCSLGEMALQVGMNLGGW